MIIKTQGIVLSYTKYKDSSIIVRILTADYGLHSFIVNNIRSAKSKRTMGLFQPFSIVEIVSYWKDQSSIHRLNDIKLSKPLHKIQTDIRKTTLSLFLAEVIQKLFQHDQTEIKDTFSFIESSIEALENMEKGIENFHIQFLIRLTSYLGIGVDRADQLEPNDLKEEQIIDDLLSCEYGTEIQVSGKMRYSILELVIKFYQVNLGYLSQIKSLKVLQQVFH